jgi:hypothetical protein
MLGSEAGFLAELAASTTVKWIAHSLLLCLVHHEQVAEVTHLKKKEGRKEGRKEGKGSSGEAKGKLR